MPPHAALAHGLSVAAIVAAGLLAVCAIAAARLLRRPATEAAAPLAHDHHRERVATHLRTRGRPNGAGPARALTDDRCQPRLPACC